MNLYRFIMSLVLAIFTTSCFARSDYFTEIKGNLESGVEIVDVQTKLLDGMLQKSAKCTLKADVLFCRLHFPGGGVDELSLTLITTSEVGYSVRITSDQTSVLPRTFSDPPDFKRFPKKHQEIFNFVASLLGEARTSVVHST